MTRLREFVTIARRVEHETVVKKSRFICVLQPVETQQQAGGELAAVKKKHYDATHNCSAVVIGADSGYVHASDDGEPQGTAGVPMLEVLQKKGLTNVLAVVTRYFGGTLLGAGGLVRAYAGSVAAAAELARCVRNIPAAVYAFTIDYADYGKLCSIASEFGAAAEGEFLEKVRADVVIRQDRAKQFEDRVTQAFMGAEVYSIQDECYIKQEI